MAISTIASAMAALILRRHLECGSVEILSLGLALNGALTRGGA